MGKGDKKSKKGKVTIGSYGNSRKKKAIKARLKRVASKGKGVSSTESSDAKKVKKTARKKAEA